ncbi:MAG: hypothetical protein Q7J27_05265 [Syntrophales bacterium]|nr:hypothetical protein [Syntrophales bacterium]
MDTRNVGKAIEGIFNEKFGGKEKGRYRISRADLLKIANEKTFNDDNIKKIQTNIQKKGFVLVDLGSEFAIIDDKSMYNYRKVTKKIVAEYAEKMGEKEPETGKKQANKKKGKFKRGESKKQA